MFKRFTNSLSKFWFDFKLYRTLCAAESLRQSKAECDEVEPKIEREPKSTIELIADTIDFIPSKGHRLIDLEVEIYRSIQSDIEKAEYQRYVQPLVNDCTRQSDLHNYDASLGYIESDSEIDALPSYEYVNETPKNQRSRLTLISMALKPDDYVSYHYINNKRDICGVILKINMHDGHSEVTTRCHKNDRLLTILISLGLPEIPLPECGVYHDDDPIVLSRKPDGTITKDREYKTKQL